VRARVTSTQLSCITRLDVTNVRAWPGVLAVHRDGERLLVTSSSADDVVRRLSREDPLFRDLAIGRAGLAEAFVEITKEAA